jgi:4-amino-4-deoxy-L-arabinose transferase-like glycosyltransferase
LAEGYIKNPEETISPNPLRTGHILSSALFLKFDDSIAALSLKSLMYFILLCLTSWWYIRKIWGEKTALIIVILISISPLLSHMAKRALIDIESLYFITLALFLFLDYLKKPNNNRFYIFLAGLSLSCFFKETAFFLIPFYICVLILYKFKKKEIPFSYFQLILFSIIPVIASFLFHFMFFQDVGLMIDIIQTNSNSFNGSNYNKIWGSGPWQQYITDFILLSPIVSITGLSYIAYSLFDKKIRIENLTLLLLSIYYIVFYSFLDKNIRFLLLFELLLIFFAGFFILRIYNYYIKEELWKKAVFYVGILFLVFLGNNSFTHYFITYNIYDPIGYNIAYAAQIIPNKKTDSIKNSNYFLNKSLEKYNAGKYLACIKEARKSIAIIPSANAYNNICAAYNRLYNYDKAIEAGKKALKLDPNHIKAKGNLNFAISKKQGTPQKRN